jgi:hypothetical protein
MKSLPIVFSLCVVATSFAAVAEPLPPQGLPPEASNPAVQAAWFACNDDIQNFCPDVQPGGGRIVRCLVFNIRSLTPACRSGMLNAKAALGR